MTIRAPIWAAGLASILAVAAMIASVAEPGRPTSTPARIRVGVGLEGVGGRGLEFVDAARTAGPFRAIGGGELTEKDGRGWPLADAQVVVFDHRPTFAWAPPADDPDAYQIDVGGTYHLAFRGRATVRPLGDPGAVAIRGQRHDPATNTTAAEVDLRPGQALLILAFTGTRRDADSPPNSGIADLRLIRPGYPPDTDRVFTDAYLRAIRPFAALRFMDFTHANDQTAHNGYYPKVLEWSDRKRPDDATQAPDGRSKGAAWEYVIALANATGKDAWINVPAEASDGYVRALAELLRAGLDPGLTIYLEHSNEVWNWGFFQATYNRMAAEDEVKRGGSNLADDGKADVETIRQRRHARRLIEIGRTFRAAFGDEAYGRRVRPVLAWWTIRPEQTEDMLAWVGRNFGPPADHFHAIATTGYFNAQEAAPDAGVEAILEAMRADADASAAVWDRFNAIARRHGLEHLAYEGGPDTGGGKPTNVANRIRAERSAAMGELVEHQVRANWAGRGGGLFMYFTLTSAYSRFGCWGATEDVTRLETPKYRALLRLMATDPGPVRGR